MWIIHGQGNEEELKDKDSPGKTLNVLKIPCAKNLGQKKPQTILKYSVS